MVKPYFLFTQQLEVAKCNKQKPTRKVIFCNMKFFGSLFSRSPSDVVDSCRVVVSLKHVRGSVIFVCLFFVFYSIDGVIAGQIRIHEDIKSNEFSISLVSKMLVCVMPCDSLFKHPFPGSYPDLIPSKLGDMTVNEQDINTVVTNIFHSSAVDKPSCLSECRIN